MSIYSVFPEEEREELDEDDDGEEWKVVPGKSMANLHVRRNMPFHFFFELRNKYASLTVDNETDDNEDDTEKVKIHETKGVITTDQLRELHGVEEVSWKRIHKLSFQSESSTYEVDTVRRGYFANGQIFQDTTTKDPKKKVVIKLLKSTNNYANIMRAKEGLNPSLASVLDVFRVHGSLFVVRDYFEVTLMAYIHNAMFKGRRLRSQLAENKICKQIATGIQYLHKRQIASGGIKIENIMLTENDGKLHAVITDNCFLDQKLQIKDLEKEIVKDPEMFKPNNVFETVHDTTCDDSDNSALANDEIRKKRSKQWLCDMKMLDVLMYAKVVKHIFSVNTTWLLLKLAEDVIEQANRAKDIKDILKSPLFFSTYEMAEHIKAFVTIQKNLGQNILKSFEKNAIDPYGWTDGFDDMLIEDLSEKGDTYDTNKAIDLARFIVTLHDFESTAIYDYMDREDTYRVIRNIIEDNHNFFPELCSIMKKYYANKKK